MSGLERRVEALEQAHDGGECPKCSRTFVVVQPVISGELVRVSKDGVPMTPPEFRQHEAEEGSDGRCPVCGNKPTVIQIGGGFQNR